MATKSKGGKKKKKVDDNKPQIIRAKGGITQAELLNLVLAKMPETEWISKAKGKLFVKALQDVVEIQISKGKPVNLFGVVRIIPRLHTSGERMVNEEFGNPDSKKVKKKVKAKVSIQGGQGIFGQKVKKALPSVQKMLKVVDR